MSVAVYADVDTYVDCTPDSSRLGAAARRSPDQSSTEKKWQTYRKTQADRSGRAEEVTGVKRSEGGGKCGKNKL